jgi:hypothetical protein
VVEAAPPTHLMLKSRAGTPSAQRVPQSRMSGSRAARQLAANWARAGAPRRAATCGRRARDRPGGRPRRRCVRPSPVMARLLLATTRCRARARVQRRQLTGDLGDALGAFPGFRPRQTSPAAPRNEITMRHLLLLVLAAPGRPGRRRHRPRGCRRRRVRCPRADSSDAVSAGCSSCLRRGNILDGMASLHAQEPTRSDQ